MSENVLGANKAPKTEKKSNAGIIVAIIVAAVIIAGGVVAAILLLPQLTKGDDNSNDNSSSQTANRDDDNNSKDGDNDGKYSKPAMVDDAYFVKIGKKEYTFRSKLSDLSESGYEVNSKVENEKVPAGKYMIMIGGGYLSNKTDDTSIKVTPYNDSNNDTTFPSAMLGSVTISDTYDKDEQAILEKIEFYGGIHLGSSREDLIEAFGEPDESKEYDNYKGGKYEKIEYSAKTWKKFEFQVEGGIVTEMSWTNYGDLNR